MHQYFYIVMLCRSKYLAPDHVLDTRGCICELVVLAILFGYLLAKPPVVESKEKIVCTWLSSSRVRRTQITKRDTDLMPAQHFKADGDQDPV